MDVDAAPYGRGWVKLGQLVAFFLVAIGVAAEFAGEWVSRPLEKIVEHSRQVEIEQLKKEAADAKLELARIVTSRVKLLTPDAVATIIEKN